MSFTGEKDHRCDTVDEKDQLLLNEARADALMLLASGDHQNTVLGRKVAELLREFTV